MQRGVGALDRRDQILRVVDVVAIGRALIRAKRIFADRARCNAGHGCEHAPIVQERAGVAATDFADLAVEIFHCLGRVAAIAVEYRVHRIATEPENQPAALPGLAPFHSQRAAVGIAMRALCVIDRGGKTVVLVLENDVDHAADRIGAIHRRGSIGEHFHPLHHRCGNRIDVHARRRGHAARWAGHAMTVDQYQGAFRPQIAQRHQRATMAEAGVERRARHEAGHRRQLLQQLAERALAAVFDALPVDHDDRAGRLCIDAAQMGTGDVDLIQGLGGVVVGCALLCACRHCNDGQDQDNCLDQRMTRGNKGLRQKGGAAGRHRNSLCFRGDNGQPARTAKPHCDSAR
ncbi:hypothetical protein XHC_2745 [Xanthomonas hortorum pv. carotae str. M081]|nr:hypothetical protein XHC_2745 [Xanthomonas hortorum pv. carotae str. M081]